MTLTLETKLGVERAESRLPGKVIVLNFSGEQL